MVRIALLSLLLGLATSAVAKDSAKVQLETGDFPAQYELIMSQFKDGETYKEITPENQRAVHGALERIARNLAEAGGVEGLSATARVAVFNDQELVNTLLTQAASDSRLICKREKKTGSRLATAQCMTVAQRNRDRERSVEILRRRPPQQLLNE